MYVFFSKYEFDDIKKFSYLKPYFVTMLLEDTFILLLEIATSEDIMKIWICVKWN